MQMLVKSCEFCEICNFIKLVKVGVDQGLIKLERSVLKQLPRVSDFSIEFPFRNFAPNLVSDGLEY